MRDHNPTTDPDTEPDTDYHFSARYAQWNVPTDSLPQAAYVELCDPDTGEIHCHNCDQHVHYCVGGTSGIGHNEQIRSYIIYADLALCGECIADAFDLPEREPPDLNADLARMLRTAHRDPDGNGDQ